MKLNPFKKEKMESALAPVPAGKKAAGRKHAPPPSRSAKTYSPGILITSRITEKATALARDRNQYVFEVARRANAQQIWRVVEAKYGVRVKKVNIINQIGKKVRLARQEGRRPGYKKAIVALAEGQIEIV